MEIGPPEFFKTIANTAVLFSRYIDNEPWTPRDLKNFLDLLEENWRGVEGHA